MERGLPSGVTAARAAMRNRMAHPTRLRLEELQPNPRNPRYAGDDPEVQEVAATLNRVGQLQPALVITREQYTGAYPDEPGLGPEPWVVIVGNRRLAASRVAGRDTLDVRVVEELTGADDIEDRVLIENVHRQNLPPLLEAEVLQRRLDRQGESLRSVAAAIGKTHTYVAQRVALLKLVPELQAMLRTGRVSIRHGRELGGRPVDEQLALAARLRAMSDEDARLFLATGGRTLATTPDGAGSGDDVGSAVNPVSSGEAIQRQDDAGEDESARPSPAVNPVSSEADASDGETGGASGSRLGTDLETARLSVTQWLDNAAAELDKVLPSGGETGPGRRLAEARQLIEQARAVLWPGASST